MKAIIGLGNPGPEYVFSRHNVGFLFLDHICSKYECDRWRDERLYLSSDFVLHGEKIEIFKPTTYMNLSGTAVGKIVEVRNLKPTEILVIYDDVSIRLGRFRVRRKGSDGGHNGMRSVISSLGTEEVPRIRIGIGPKPPGVKLADFVLSDFSDEELRILYKVFDFALEALRVIIKDGIDKAMSLYNSIEVVP